MTAATLAELMATPPILFVHLVNVKLERSPHRALEDLHVSRHPADRWGLNVHLRAFPQLLGRESRRLPGPSLLDADPLQACLYPFAGGLHEVCPSGEHHPAEELGCGAVVGSVATFPEGYENDIPLGEIPLDLHARVEVPVEPVRPSDDYDVACRIWSISTFQPVQDMELPVISSVKMCSSRIPNSWRTWGWVSGFRVASPVLLTRA